MKLRSARWFDGGDEVALSHRVALRLTEADRGRPVIGIADTSSALNPCNAGLADLVAEVERGIRDGGGLPARFPVMSLGEDLMKPTAMLYRNLVAMELEETVRANPIDGVVFLANCDKSVPAALLAAASTDIPSLLLIGGSRAAPAYAGKPLGSGTDLWRALDERRTGRMDERQWQELESTLRCAGPGACNTMGTASSMAIVTELLGMCLPGSAGVPAGGARLQQIAWETGRLVAEHVRREWTPTQRITQAAWDNAVRGLAAVGGSTNAVIHLAAVAGRLGLAGDLTRMDRLWRDVPLLADVEPCGARLVAAFAAAGGVPALVRAMGPLVDGGTVAGDGRSWAQVAAAGGAGAAASSQGSTTPAGVIRSLDDPVRAAPTLAAVFGSLAPDGAVVKVAAATPQLLQHRGRAVVFDDYDAMRARLDDPAAGIEAGDVVIVRGCGPKGAPGMPEWGMAPIPKRLLARGVPDMLRITDGRMSGTSFGTVVLHVAPEAAAGGPLGRVAEGDTVELDLAGRRLDLLVDPEQLATRTFPQPAAAAHLRGWPRLYADHVQQAPQGADLDFLAGPTEAARRFIEPTVGRS
ncbi:MAG: dihydroxy-acid dehydratase [Micromonosporaceae bacterium]|nr:dihydroxy-acid dehydratase [Micromonosporaceae bacterium]